MKEIERIIDKFTLNKPYLYSSDRKKLSGLLEQYVIKAREEVIIALVPNHLIIEKCLWFGKDNDLKREMRIEINHIDNDLSKPLNYEEAFKKAIAELKKGLK